MSGGDKSYEKHSVGKDNSDGMRMVWQSPSEGKSRWDGDMWTEAEEG